MKRLDFFGSYATGTATSTRDVDFVVYGCKDILRLEEDLDEIDTLRTIDIFNYDEIHNEFLLEDIREYGRKNIRRYQTFCKCFDNLQRSKYLDPDAANPIE